MPSPLSIQCPSCQGLLKLPSREAAGRRVRCPRCQHEFVAEIPEQSQPPQDEFDDFFSGAGASDFEEDYGSPAPRTTRPRKRPAKKAANGPNRKAMGAVIGGGVAVALLLVGAVFLFGGRGASADGNAVDLTYLPPDTEMVIRVNWRDVWNSDFVQTIAESPAIKPQIDAMRQMQGDEFDIDDIDSLTVGLSGFAQVEQGGQPEWVVVLRTRERLRDDMKENAFMFRPVEHGGETYYVMNNAVMPIPVTVAMRLVDSYTAVVGSEASVRGTIDRGTESKRRPELDFIDGSQNVVIAIMPQNRDQFLENADLPGAGEDESEPGKKFAEVSRKEMKAACIGLHFADDISIKLQLNCETAAGAAEMKTALDALIAQGKTEYAQAKEQGQQEMAAFASVVQIADEVVNGLSASQAEQTVVVTTRVPASAASSFVNLLPILQQMQGGADPFGGGGFDDGGFDGGDGGFDGGEIPGGFPPPGGF